MIYENKIYENKNGYFNYGRNNLIHETAIIYDCVEIGCNNIIEPYTVIGRNGYIRNINHEDFKGKVKIGDNNIIGAYTSIGRPCHDKYTQIGNNNLIMCNVSIGHDVVIGDNVEICCGVIIGGYAVIKDGVKIKIASAIRNRIVIGSNVIIGMGAIVVNNVNDNLIVKGNPAK